MVTRDNERGYSLAEFRAAARRVARLLDEERAEVAEDTDPETLAYLAALRRAANYMADVAAGRS